MQYIINIFIILILNRMKNAFAGINFPKYYTLIVLFIFPWSINNLKAQIADRYLGMYGNISMQKLREDRFSPLVYSGPGMGGKLIYEKNKKKIFQQYSLNILLGILSNTETRTVMGSQIYTGRYEADYIWYYKIAHTNLPLEAWLGGSFSFMTFDRQHGNFYNNRNAYDVFSGLGIRSIIRYKFNSGKRNWDVQISGGLHLPGIKIHPSYGNSAPEGFLNPENKTHTALLKSIKIAHPGNFFTPQYQWLLRYYLHNGNFLSIGVSHQFIRTMGAGNSVFMQYQRSVLLGWGLKF